MVLKTHSSERNHSIPAHITPGVGVMSTKMGPKPHRYYSACSGITCSILSVIFVTDVQSQTIQNWILLIEKGES